MSERFPHNPACKALGIGHAVKAGMSKTTNYPGQDYSAGQPINRNLNTGIRYGIIPSSDVNPDALEDIYSHGASACPERGSK